MKKNGQWTFFEEFFKKEGTREFDSVRGKAPLLTEPELVALNVKLKMFDDLSKLDVWADNREREGG
jgi:hypothetical protein